MKSVIPEDSEKDLRCINRHSDIQTKGFFMIDENGKHKHDNIDWHLNKSVSLSVIVLLIANIATSVWWLAGINRDVEILKARPNLTERVTRLETRLDSQDQLISKMDITLTNINNNVIEIAKELSRRKPLADALERELYNRPNK